MDLVWRTPEDGIAASRHELAALRAQLGTAAVEIAHLRAQSAALRRQQYGRSSERLDAEIAQLELRLEGQIETVKRSRFERRSQQIGRVFDDYRQWVNDTLTTEPQPWIQVLAAVCNPVANPADRHLTAGA